MELARDEALEGQATLRTEMKALHQSVSATFRMDTTLAQAAANKGAAPAGAAGATDVDTSTRLNEAKADAKIRQLTNKLEFLKAQLASEQATAEDFKVAAERDRQKVEDLRADFRVKTAEMERLKQEAVEEAEKRVERAFEDRMRVMAARSFGARSRLSSRNCLFCASRPACRRRN
jgi:hypothetical protein